ncbi:DUF2851 family protein [Rariglobus hedericola]|uniref:DUF2851 family protein n=1 Tax=Rariglobus hedericola TaxID=2597822 RepID=UPI001EF0B93B|nr:DUF2851 family protein [Rariglobus hedericola]
MAEVQGLYGTFSFPERLLQKIWQRGDFDLTATRLSDGRAIKILYAGKWNHLGGPDFSAARLSIDGRELTGDVELHLHARDWVAHGHAGDPAYGNVVLHVVLFPCAELETNGVGGRKIPVLCLLPLLHHGLEEYAAEEAMEHLAGRPLHQAQEVLGALSNEELNTLLSAHAKQRWTGKVHFAGERIKRLGWEGACHHAALEVLGYRFNRAPMLSVATLYPLVEWTEGRVDPARVFEEMADRWSVQGVRPLNHPRLRLRQYAEWCTLRPDWVVRLREDAGLRDMAAASTSSASINTGEWRRTVRLTAQRLRVQDQVCGGVVSGSRLDNLVCDGFLPLLAAQTGLNFQPVWAGWYAGDAPEALAGVLQALGVFGARGQPAAQGPIQGLLGWMLAREGELRGA